MILNPWTAGALCDSSRYLAAEMCKATALAHPRHIIELGPGHGIFTRGLREIAPVTCVELNPEFEAVLKPLADVHIKDVFHFLNYGFATPGTYVSGLPHIMLGEVWFKKLLDGVSQFCDQFILFTYWRWTLEQWIQEHGAFKVTRKRYVFRNIPPAWVLTLKPI